MHACEDRDGERRPGYGSSGSLSGLGGSGPTAAPSPAAPRAARSSGWTPTRAARRAQIYEINSRDWPMGGWGSTRSGDIPPKPRTDSVWDLRVTDVVRVAPVRRGRLSKGTLPCTRTGPVDVVINAMQRGVGVRLEFRRLLLGKWE